MPNTFLRYTLRYIAILVLATNSLAQAEESQLKTVNGLNIYYGILPAEMVHGHEMEHGGSKFDKGAHHLVVAIFNTKTGKRITDADVEATVTLLGLAGEIKKLEPMNINQSMTFGNYFRMPDPLPYQITVRIRLSGSREWFETTFEYRHP